MVLQVVVDERLDEVVAVVVPRVAAQREGLANLRACCLEQVGVQLPFQKLVRQALVDEWRASPVPLCPMFVQFYEKMAPFLYYSLLEEERMPPIEVR